MTINKQTTENQRNTIKQQPKYEILFPKLHQNEVQQDIIKMNKKMTGHSTKRNDNKN